MAIGVPASSATIPAADLAIENTLSSTTNYQGPYVQSLRSVVAQ